MQRDDRTIGAAAMNDSRSPSFRSGKEGAAFFEGVPAARPNGAAKRPCGGSDGAARVAVASVLRSRSRLGRTAERSVRPTRRLPCGARFGKGRAGRRAARSRRAAQVAACRMSHAGTAGLPSGLRPAPRDRSLHPLRRLRPACGLRRKRGGPPEQSRRLAAGRRMPSGPIPINLVNFATKKIFFRKTDTSCRFF